MRTYVVQPGDSPASIAAKNGAECPKCSRDLTLANSHKATVTHPNGYITFESLAPGEVLILPEKWFEPRFELLPPAYFGSLPYADGVTPSPFGTAAPGILRDFRALDVAADKLRVLIEVDDRAFANSVGDVAEAIDVAVRPALSSSNEAASRYAFSAKEAVRAAIPSSKMFMAFAASGLSTAEARADVQNALASALTNAQHAIHDLYATTQPEHR